MYVKAVTRMHCFVSSWLPLKLCCIAHVICWSQVVVAMVNYWMGHQCPKFPSKWSNSAYQCLCHKYTSPTAPGRRQATCTSHEPNSGLIPDRLPLDLYFFQLPDDFHPDQTLYGYDATNFLLNFTLQTVNRANCNCYFVINGVNTPTTQICFLL